MTSAPSEHKPPTHINRPRKNAPTIQQRISQAQKQSTRSRKVNITLPAFPAKKER